MVVLGDGCPRIQQLSWRRLLSPEVETSVEESEFGDLPYKKSPVDYELYI